MPSTTPNQKKGPQAPFLPAEIYYILDSALLRLVSDNDLPKEFSGENLFQRLRIKFNNAIGHRKKVISFEIPD